MQEYLKETDFLDFKHPSFDAFLSDFQSSIHNKVEDKKQMAVQLYYWVRDAFLYDPYHLNLTYDGLKASNVIGKKRSWCVEKAVLLAACLRRFYIPSRLGFAIVTNHIGVDKLVAYLGREEIVFHGYVEVYLNDTWVKCTPAFDKRICAISRVSPLDWDGVSDSLFQEFENGQRFMEYKHFYGVFSDVPIELMNAEMKKYYPHLFEKEYTTKEFSFFHLEDF